MKSKLILKKIDITKLQGENMKNIIGGNGIIEKGLSDRLCEATVHRPAACPTPQPKQTQINCCTYVNCPK